MNSFRITVFLVMKVNHMKVFFADFDKSLIEMDSYGVKVISCIVLAE